MLQSWFECLFSATLLPIHPEDEGKSCSDLGSSGLFCVTLVLGEPAQVDQRPVLHHLRHRGLRNGHGLTIVP